MIVLIDRDGLEVTCTPTAANSDRYRDCTRLYVIPVATDRRATR